MFFDEFQKDKLSHLWGEFAKIKSSYTPNERWKEIIDSEYKNADFAALTLDNIIYDFYKNTYNEESEENCVPCVCTSTMVILAKKTNIDYDVEMVLPSYEFTTYFETTRIDTVFERTRNVSEMQDEYQKYENKLKELFPEETTLWNLLNNVENAEKYDELCENNDGFGIGFIDVFTNILAYDFVRNYLLLPNERDLSIIYSKSENSIFDTPTDDMCEDDYDWQCDYVPDSPPFDPVF